LKGKKKMLGIEYSNTLTSVNNLALIFRNQEKYKAAEEIHRRALKERKKMIKIEHSDILANVNNLTLILRKQRKYEKAEEMNRRTLKKKKKILEIEYSSTLISVGNLISMIGAISIVNLIRLSIPLLSNANRFIVSTFSYLS
jgi:tetratricopeptide (TPR) repeat protein